VDVLNDSLYEANETFKVALSNPLNGTLGAQKESTGTIEADDDVAPTLKVTGGSIVEGDPGSGDRFMEFVVQRTGATGADLSFKFSAPAATASGDTAVAGIDYEALVNETFTNDFERDEQDREGEDSAGWKSGVRRDLHGRDHRRDGCDNFGRGWNGEGTILDDDVKVSIKPGSYSGVGRERGADGLGIRRRVGPLFDV
jgi:hypothetical protein